MLFGGIHIELIKQGIKTKTRRRWKRRAELPGNYYPAKTTYAQKLKDCRVWYKVLNVKLVRQGDMTEADAQAEGGYSLHEFKTLIWPKFGKAAWDDDELVYEVEFMYIDRCPECGGVLCNCDKQIATHCRHHSSCGWGVRMVKRQRPKTEHFNLKDLSRRIRILETHRAAHAKTLEYLEQRIRKLEE